MNKHIKTMLCYLLTLCLVCGSIPMMANAETQEAEQVTETEQMEVEGASDKPYVIGEVVEKREANVKHFRMSDGSVMAAMYPQEVHYENEEGALVDINNSLVEGNDESDSVYENNKNDFHVKFMKKSNKNKLYTLNKGKDKITVSIEGVSKVKATPKELHAQKEAIESDYGLSNLGSSIVYSDIFEHVDIEYTIISKTVKENIILKEAVDFNRLVYHYKFDNHLEAVAQDEQTIMFRNADTGEIAFQITAPAMWDSAGNYHDDLTLTLLEAKNGKTTIELVWDAEKLEDAVYPVTIDPVLSFSYGRLEIKDTYIVKSTGTTNYNVRDHLKLRNDGYALLEFPTPELNSGDKIVYSELILAPYMFLDGATSEYSNTNSYNPSLYITSHKILKSWDESTVTYNNAGADSGFYDSTVYSYRILDNDNDFYRWDITRLANEWTESGVANNGVLLKFDREPSDGSIANAFFCSTNGTYNPAAYYPQIFYQYINTTGVEDYFSYHTQDLGYAGTAYTNDLTGNLTIINPVVQTGGSVMPITVSLVYNSNNVMNSPTPYGRGWKLNWAQKIDWSVKSNADNTQYVKYTDGDGTNHFFTVDDSTGIWTNEINPDQKIYYMVDTNDYKMTDRTGTDRYFKRNGTLNEWYLYKIVDSYGNYIQITLNSSNLNRVEKVVSSTGNTVDFGYSEFGFLTNIYYYDGDTTKQISVKYNQHVTNHNNGVSDIVYPDGTAVEYHYYNNTYYPSKIYDIDGQRTVYNYKWDVPLRVNYVAQYSSSSELGSVMKMSYETTGTVFTDVTNNRTYLYTFAQNGTLKSTVDITENDGNGYGQYYEFNYGNTTETTGTNRLTFLSKRQKNTVNLLPNHSFETDGYHKFIAWNETTDTASGSYDSQNSHIGARSYQITRPDTSDSTRALGYYYLYLEGGKTYTLSAYVNTKDMISSGKGASLLFIGSEQTCESEYLTETVDSWQRLSLKFTTTTSEYVSICMSLYEATGSVYFDNIQLEEGNLSDYNLLENAGFEDDISATPRGWNASTNKGSISETDQASGKRAAHICGNISKHIHYMQTIKMPDGKKGDTYVASAFAKANSVPASGSMFTLLVRFT